MKAIVLVIRTQFKQFNRRFIAKYDDFVFEFAFGINDFLMGNFRNGGFY